MCSWWFRSLVAVARNLRRPDVGRSGSSILGSHCMRGCMIFVHETHLLISISDLAFGLLIGLALLQCRLPDYDFSKQKSPVSDKDN